ncbi:MAG: hypothetical protein IK062_08230 [Selenomonadaceae bacterium]|nr:hypothetical protein [Selenomonadaceae bacterium]
MTVAVIIFIFAVMLALNNLMPLHRDDYDYSMVWKAGEHINSLSDVFNSTYRHYFFHGGRFFSVFCLNLFLWLGKIPFDIVNALFFAVLVVMIYIHARRNLKFENEFGILAAAGLLAWLSFPHFGEVAIWKSGSTVYLWSAIPVIFFLLPYNLEMAGTWNLWNGKIFVCAMFLLGIISGGSVENLGVTVTVLTAGISFYCHRKKIMKLWMPAGALGSLIGLIIMISAPGNFVRYDVQSNGKGILAHIGNQFAGNGEMILYLLPVILILYCAFNLMKISAAKKRRITFASTEFNFPKSSGILLGLAIIFIISYFNDSFITRMIRDFFMTNIFPNFNVSEKFLERFDNFMMKSEEMIIYLLIIFSIYLPLRNSLGFVGTAQKRFTLKISFGDILNLFPQVRYSLFLFALAIFNNFVMIFAPTFPARATFSSVVMILIGTLAIMRLPIVHKKLYEGSPGVILKFGAFLLGSFTIISALVITYELRQENDWRVAEVEKAAAEGRDVVTFPPIELKNRALRHVFFVDFDNGVTRDGLCEFYRIKKIEVEEEK